MTLPGLYELGHSLIINSTPVAAAWQIIVACKFTATHQCRQLSSAKPGEQFNSNLLSDSCSVGHLDYAQVNYCSGVI